VSGREDSFGVFSLRGGGVDDWHLSAGVGAQGPSVVLAWEVFGEYVSQVGRNVLGVTRAQSAGEGRASRCCRTLEPLGAVVALFAIGLGEISVACLNPVYELLEVDGFLGRLRVAVVHGGENQLRLGPGGWAVQVSL